MCVSMTGYEEEDKEEEEEEKKLRSRRSRRWATGGTLNANS